MNSARRSGGVKRNGKDGNARKQLFPEHEIQSQPANLDHVAVVQPYWAVDRLGIDERSLVARSDVITIVALVDLRRDLGLEPALQPHRRHFRFADDRQLAGDHIFFLVGVTCEHRSEEHTSELQSLTNLVCRLLLEKKKKIQKTNYH